MTKPQVDYIHRFVDVLNKMTPSDNWKFAIEENIVLPVPSMHIYLATRDKPKCEWCRRLTVIPEPYNEAGILYRYDFMVVFMNRLRVGPDCDLIWRADELPWDVIGICKDDSWLLKLRRGIAIRAHSAPILLDRWATQIGYLCKQGMLDPRST